MHSKIGLSVLDLCPILSGQTATQSFKHSVDLAAFAEGLGCRRFWMAEHHNMSGIGSSSPEVLIAHVASATKRIRVGSGGIMLPNHAALHVAEVFRTLTALYPGRIDLGVGRAPGSDSRAASALRGGRGLTAENFPQQFSELVSYLDDQEAVVAVPSHAEAPQLWLLGSSDFGALMAADRGLPYAFAQHFSHLPALEIISLYRDHFVPSRWLEKPRSMMGVHVICADTDEEARELALSSDLSFSLFVQTGKSIPLPTVAEARAYPYSEEDWKKVRASAMPKFVGSASTVERQLAPYLRAGVLDELMVLTMVHDQGARRRSYELLRGFLS